MRVRVIHPEGIQMLRADGSVEYSHATGEVVDFRPDQARRWLRRGRVEEVSTETPKAEKPKEAPKEDPVFLEERRPLAESGESSRSGPAEPSSASHPAPASVNETSKGSDAQEPKTDAESSSRTEPGSEPDGQTSSTGRTRRGGGKRGMRRGSRGGKSA